MSEIGALSSFRKQGEMNPHKSFGHPRLLMRGLIGARAEIGIATMAYNLKRTTNVLGAEKLTKAFL